MYGCFCPHKCIHSMHIPGVSRGQKMGSGPLELKLQIVNEPQCGCQALNLRPSKRAASVLNHQAISQAPSVCGGKSFQYEFNFFS